MLYTEAVSPQLLAVVRQLMEVESLSEFRLVGGSALALQLGHRESIDIDLFPQRDFQAEKVCRELTEKFSPERPVKSDQGVMIRTVLNGIKIDIVDSLPRFIRPPVIEDGIRMAHPEEIAAMKLKMACDPFSGRRTKKDYADIAVLLEKYTLKEMTSFFREKYFSMAPYTENVVIQLKKTEDAEQTPMPRMLNGMTWDDVKHRIQDGLRSYFDGIIAEREKALKRKSSGKK